MGRRSDLVKTERFDTYLIKDILELILCQRRTLNILDSTKLLRHAFTVLLTDRAHLLLRQLLAHAWIIAQIGLSTNNQARNTWAVMVNLWEPLLADVFERGWGCHGEADKEDVGLWVGERAQTVIILLSGSIEETESIWLITDPVRSELALFDDSDIQQGSVVDVIVRLVSAAGMLGTGYREAAYMTVTA